MNESFRGTGMEEGGKMRCRTNISRRSVLHHEISSGNGYIFQEDYGFNDAADNSIQKKRNRLFMSFWGPMARLWSCRRTLMNPAVISAVAMMSSLISIQFVDSLVVTVASALTMSIGLLVLLQQRKLRRLGNLRRQHNELRRRANFFHQERERLYRAQERLDQTLADLHYIPLELHKLSNNNQDVNRLTQILEEQRVVQEAIRKKIQQRVMKNLIGVVVNANREDDFALGPQEIEKAILRLNMVKGIKFNETRFRQMLEEDPSIRSVFQMLRSMQERDDEFQYCAQPVFVINPPRTVEEAV
jgi:hypothetical protein